MKNPYLYSFLMCVASGKRESHSAIGKIILCPSVLNLVLEITGEKSILSKYPLQIDAEARTQLNAGHLVLSENRTFSDVTHTSNPRSAQFFH